MAADVFISYSRKDQEHARRLAERLRERGLEVWIDQEGIAVASSWSGEIVDAIEQCRAFVLLLSESSVRSENVARELSLASENHRKIVPVEIESVALPREFRYQLAGIQRASISQLDPIVEAIGEAAARGGGRAAPMLGGGRAEQPPSIHSPSSKTRRWVPLAGLVMVALVAVVLYLRKSPSEMSLAGQSLGILPFEGGQANEDVRQLAAGIGEAVLDRIAQSDAQTIPSRQSIDDYGPNASLAQLGRELRCSYFVRGRVSNASQLRLEVLDAASEKAKWVKEYSLAVNDPVGIQDSIVSDLARLFALRLPTSVRTLRKVDPDAYRLYLRASAVHDPRIPETLDLVTKAADLCDQAVRIDPTFAAGYARKADYVASQAKYLGSKRPGLLDSARELTMKALLLDPKLPEAYRTLSHIYLWMGRTEDCVSAAKTAHDLAPQDLDCLTEYADRASLLHQPEAVRAARVLLQRDSTNLGRLTTALYVFDRCADSSGYREAARYYREAYLRYKRSHPDDLDRESAYVMTLVYSGDTVEANKAVDELAKRVLASRNTLAAYNLACQYARLGRREEALNTLARVIRETPLQAKFAMVDRDFSSLKNDPRFRRLVAGN